MGRFSSWATTVGGRKPLHILIDNSCLPKEVFTHKHRVAAIASATTYAEWKRGNLPRRTFASLTSYRLIVGHGMDNVVVSPPLDDLADMHGNSLDPAKSHHAVMMLLGDVHDHVHVVAALGRACSALIPKLIGTRTDDSKDISTWLGDLTERERLLTESCARLQVQLHDNQRSHILDITNSLVFFNPIASGAIP